MGREEESGGMCLCFLWNLLLGVKRRGVVADINQSVSTGLAGSGRPSGTTHDVDLSWSEEEVFRYSSVIDTLCVGNSVGSHPRIVVGTSYGYPRQAGNYFRVHVHKGGQNGTGIE